MMRRRIAAAAATQPADLNKTNLFERHNATIRSVIGFGSGSVLHVWKRKTNKYYLYIMRCAACESSQTDDVISDGSGGGLVMSSCDSKQ